MLGGFWWKHATDRAKELLQTSYTKKKKKTSANNIKNTVLHTVSNMSTSGWEQTIHPWPTSSSSPSSTGDPFLHDLSRGWTEHDACENKQRCDTSSLCVTGARQQSWLISHIWKTWSLPLWFEAAVLGSLRPVPGVLQRQIPLRDLLWFLSNFMYTTMWATLICEFLSLCVGRLEFQSHLTISLAFNVKPPQNHCTCHSQHNVIQWRHYFSNTNQHHDHFLPVESLAHLH